MKTLPSNTIDCFICDLPFGCLALEPVEKANPANKHRKEYAPTERKGCPWDVKINLPAFWEQIKRLAKDENTPVLMFCTTKFGYELIKSNESWFRYDLVWNKGRGVSFLNANKMPMRSHEMVYVFSKSGAFYNRVDVKGTPYNTKQKSNSVNVYNAREPVETVNEGTRCVLSVIDVSKTCKRQQHPTEKPVELYKWLVERYCPRGGTVLDPTAGSFNSCFAAFELDRNSIGIEKDPAFYEKACKRADSL